MADSDQFNYELADFDYELAEAIRQSVQVQALEEDYAAAVENSMAESLLDGVLQATGPLEPGANPWNVVKFLELKSEERANFLSDRDRIRVKVFRAQVPANRQGVVGPEGLNLRVTYHMHAVAIERDGRVSFDVDAQTRLNEGDFLWFGVMGDAKSIVGMKQFLESEHLDDVRRGDLPIFAWNVPPAWQHETLAKLDLRRKYGISIIGFESGGETKFFPPPGTPLPLKECTMLMSIASINKFMEIRHRCIQRHGYWTGPCDSGLLSL